jgi:septal ring factor EnvC (AmiA/AmiB activator)
VRRNNSLFALLFCGITIPALAQQTLPADRLDELEQQIQQGQEQLQEQEAEYDRVTGELAAMRGRAIEIAREIQGLERRLSGIEERLANLHGEETATIANLNHRRLALTDILAALQILERNKPPALLVRPDDAVQAARSAMLLGAVLPELEVQMTGLRTQLDTLALLRDSIETEQADLASTANTLAEEENELDALMAEREVLTQELAQILESDRRRIAGYAAEADNLRGLINRLTRQFSEAAPVLRPSPNAGPIVSRFAEALGNLRIPAAGRVLGRFGDTLELGTHSQGIAVATRPGARITAPFDSEIVFAAPYRGYGQLLILSPGDGYLILMSGLARIDGVVGQQVLTGEPLGIMGSETLAPNVRRWAVSSDAVEAGEPVLYLEMREDGEAVDPLPWFREDQWRVDGS